MEKRGATDGENCTQKTIILALAHDHVEVVPMFTLYKYNKHSLRIW
jgi:hypothetical protein